MLPVITFLIGFYVGAFLFSLLAISRRRRDADKCLNTTSVTTSLQETMDDGFCYGIKENR